MRDSNTLDAGDLLGAVYNGIVAIDGQGVIVCFNETAERLFDASSKDAVGRYILDVLPRTGGRLLDVMKTGKTLLGERLKWGGSTLIANISPVLREREIAGAISVFQDMSEIEQVSRELDIFKNTKKWLDTIVDSSYDGLWICDNTGKVMRINGASERINGVRAQDVLGRNMEELVKEGFFDKSVTQEVLKRKTTFTMIQQLKGGKRILVTGNPIFNEEGEISFVVTNDRDISELDQLRAELEETQALAQGYVSRLSQLEMKEVSLSHLVFQSKEIEQILEMSIRVAAASSAVLLLGESGVGKGAVAKVIHLHSERKSGPFIRVDCGSVPESLLESELFGYERGAFTGARTEGKAGLFELASGGTLFLDEVGEIPLSFQPKLLRFLEEHELIRVGGTSPRRIDVRVIAATNRDIERMVASGFFREDLYYRLNVVPIHIPPLRERKDDVLPLLYHFLAKFNMQNGKRKIFSPEAIEAFFRYHYPGNIRELANIVERGVVVALGERIELTDLPGPVSGYQGRGSGGDAFEESATFRDSLRKYERLVIEAALAKYGSQFAAARALGLNQSTISRKIKR